MDTDRIAALLEDACADDMADIGRSRVCSGLQAVVWADGELHVDTAVGHAELGDAPRPMTPRTPVDIASITKALVTATLAMQAVDRRIARFDDPIARFVPAWADGAGARRDEATLLQLLNHSSGLPAWEKFYLRYPVDPTPAQAEQTRQAVFDEIVAWPLEGAPASRHCYSDLGYILLCHILETLYDEPLSDVARRQIFAPLGMDSTRYVARFLGDPPLTDAAATEACPLRDRVIVGTVHDENTDIQGGVSGHAGVFSTGGDLLKFARHMLSIDAGYAHGIVRPETLGFAWSEAARGAGGHHLGGWDTPSGEVSSAGRGFAAGRTVGHLGFTGTSLWIERDSRTIAILLTNRVYPSRDNDRIKALRVAFHELVAGG